MTKSFPYLALDSAGRRTILCDHPVPMFGDNTTKKETTRITLSADQLTRYVGMRIRNPAAANRYWARCMGRDIAADAALDDETAEKLKGFLKTKLSPGDHAQVCDMLEAAGEPDVEAQDDADTEPGVPPLPKVRLGGAAADAAFRSMYPGLAHVRIDTSGLPVPKRAAGQSSDVASFNAMFPGLATIRLA